MPMFCISIHVPREGHDVPDRSRAPVRLDFNPRAPRGARRQRHLERHQLWLISIHVPREGHDRDEFQRMLRDAEFQSTCPARGTTHKFGHLDDGKEDISIHVPREGHDSTLGRCFSRLALFQSTCPARGTTILSLQKFYPGFTYFNPRAPRGARRLPSEQIAQNAHFNPRAPRGARPKNAMGAVMSPAFQSTCPARGTTWLDNINLSITQAISIHVPREGHDQSTHF